MKILHRLPLDDWFDDVSHPYDTWPVATDKNLETSFYKELYHKCIEHSNNHKNSLLSFYQ